MSATIATLRGRLAAEKLMQDTCTVTRITSRTTDPDAGVVTPTYTTIYSGMCRIQQRGAIARQDVVGEAALWIQGHELQLPISATGVEPDDIVTCTASGLDPELVGRVWHVRGHARKTHLTARRLQMEELMS